MTVHTMRLHTEPFEQLESGQRNFEIRIFDEKRRAIKLGDQVEFISRATHVKIIKTVVAITIAKSFEVLFEKIFRIPMYVQANFSIQSELKLVYQYYSFAEEEKYGVVALCLR